LGYQFWCSGIESNLTERFTSLNSYKIKGSKATTLIFSSGKLVCAGENSEVKAESAVSELYETLTEKRLLPKLSDPTV